MVYREAPPYVSVLCKELVTQFIKNRKRFVVHEMHTPSINRFDYKILDTSVMKEYNVCILFTRLGHIEHLKSADNLFTEDELEWAYLRIMDYFICLDIRKNRILKARKKSEAKRKQEELLSLYNLK